MLDSQHTISHASFADLWITITKCDILPGHQAVIFCFAKETAAVKVELNILFLWTKGEALH
jgi:hypothetical protein